MTTVTGKTRVRLVIYSSFRILQVIVAKVSNDDNYVISQGLEASLESACFQMLETFDMLGYYSYSNNNNLFVCFSNQYCTSFC